MIKNHLTEAEFQEVKIGVQSDLEKIALAKAFLDSQEELITTRDTQDGFFKRIFKKIAQEAREIISESEYKLIALAEFLADIGPILYSKGYFRLPRYYNIFAWIKLINALSDFIKKLKQKDEKVSN